MIIKFKMYKANEGYFWSKEEIDISSSMYEGYKTPIKLCAGLLPYYFNLPLNVEEFTLKLSTKKLPNYLAVTDLGSYLSETPKEALAFSVSSVWRVLFNPKQEVIFAMVEVKGKNCSLGPKSLELTQPLYIF